jgi:tetratricopeptide (TPR) repeat protein
METSNIRKTIAYSFLVLYLQTSFLSPALSEAPGSPTAVPDALRIARPHSDQVQIQDATALLKGGIEKHRNGDDQGAEADFQQALKLDPANANAHFNLAALEEGRGEIAAALEEYHATLRYDPSDQSALAAINQLEGAGHGQSEFQETHLLRGSAQESSLLPSASAFANPTGASVNTPVASNTLSAKASTKQPKPKGGTMRALKAVGLIALKTAVAVSNSGAMYAGRTGVGTGTVDTCACNTLGN